MQNFHAKSPRGRHTYTSSPLQTRLAHCRTPSPPSPPRPLQRCRDIPQHLFSSNTSGKVSTLSTSTGGATSVYLNTAILAAAQLLGFQLLHKRATSSLSPLRASPPPCWQCAGRASPRCTNRREVVLLKDEIRQPSLLYRHEAEVRAAPTSTHLPYSVNF